MIHSSFRDPDSRLFTRNGQLLRELLPSYRDNYTRLITSGLYAELVRRELIIPHTEIGDWVIAPQVVPFISYPYEWCFDAYRDAALATLEIQSIASEYGMTLKDASAYNIQFYNRKPTLIDTTSFVEYRNGEPWIAYSQFCRHFLSPLALMCYRDLRLGMLMRTFIDGIPVDLASRLLPKLSLNISLSLHIHGQAVAKSTTSRTRSWTIRKEALLGVVNNLRSIISRMRETGTGKGWSRYTKDTSYSLLSVGDKSSIVREYIRMAKPSIIWDMGANDGSYSQLGIEEGAKQVLAFDRDHSSVNRCYKRLQDPRILPLVFDLTNPSPGIGWAGTERESILDRRSADLVMALALVHHLAIGNNTPLPLIAEWFRSLGEWLIIEFVPKNDPQVQRILSGRTDVFGEYTLSDFLLSFSKFYTLIDERNIRASCRSIYLFRVK